LSVTKTVIGRPFVPALFAVYASLKLTRKLAHLDDLTRMNLTQVL